MQSETCQGGKIKVGHVQVGLSFVFTPFNSKLQHLPLPRAFKVLKIRVLKFLPSWVMENGRETSAHAKVPVGA